MLPVIRALNHILISPGRDKILYVPNGLTNNSLISPLIEQRWFAFNIGMEY